MGERTGYHLRTFILLGLLATACANSNVGGPADADGDGWASAEDCDDADAAVFPGAVERCNGVDDDCDGTVDPDDAEDVLTFFGDSDGDGFGDPAITRVACDPGPGWVADASDCDDLEAAVHPGAAESCDGRDEDCDGVVDPPESVDALAWFGDDDGDGHGDPSRGATGCSAPAGFVASADDCDDADPARHPGVLELCNLLDDDCDGTTDPTTSADAPMWFLDADADGAGAPDSGEPSCGQPAGRVATDDDCDDTDAAVHPGATERCNSIDDDCDGVTDPGTSVDAATWFYDRDGDGFGDAAASVLACSVPAGAGADASDCADTEASVYPGAIERCNSIDDDCDGVVDPDSSVDAGTWYTDADADGFGGARVAAVACLAPTGSVASSTDCDDAVSRVFPGASETCDGVDEDCNGVTDDNPTDGSPTYVDADGDGFGDSTTEEDRCDVPDGYSAADGDCDDALAEVNPTAAELCWNGFDDDCDGADADDIDCAPVGIGWPATVDVDGSSSVTLTLGIAGLGDVYSVGAGTLVVSGGTTTGEVWLFADPLASAGSSLARGNADSVITSGTASDGFGAGLISAGDLDGDGAADLAVGASSTGAGAVYLFYSTTLPGATSPSSADVVLTGAQAADATGATLCSAGDIDSDGLADVLVGAAGNDERGSGSGVVWLVPGGSSTHTFSMTGDGVFVGDSAGDGLGPCAGLGDVDGDGHGDVALGAPGNDEAANNAGRVYIFRGPIDDRRRQAGAGWLRITGSAASQAFGSKLSSAGDVDGDGELDLLVGAPGYDEGTHTDAGAVALYYGPLPGGVLDLSAANVTIKGDGTGDAGALPVASADLDADGWSDVIFGAPGSSALGSLAGGAFVFYGPVVDGTYAFSDADALLSDAARDAAGALVVSLGDLDDDGDDEIATSALGSSVGQVRVYGGGSRLEATASLPDEATDDDADGYAEVDGDCDDGRAGRSPGLTEVCGAGPDEDCDGRADRCAPATTEVFSAATVFVASSVNYTAADFGSPVRIVGDLNGDGAADIAVGDRWYASSVGRTWIYFGPTPPGSYTEDDADVAITGIWGGRGLGDINDDGFDDLYTEDGIFFGGPGLYGVLASTDADLTTDFGRDVFPVGDVDGDGAIDLQGWDGTTSSLDHGTSGVATVWFGPFSASSTTAGPHSVWVGNTTASRAGETSARVGDLNGDGVDDLVFSAVVDTDFDNTGPRTPVYELVVKWGPVDRAEETPMATADVFLQSLEDSIGDAWSAGDLDGDGVVDLVVPTSEGGYPALAMVAVAGRQGVSNVEDEAYAVLYTDSLDLYDIDVECADVDRDGFADLIVGGYELHGPGAVWVFRGPLAGDYELADADYTVNGVTDEAVGAFVSVGDLDGDGFDDFVGSAHQYGGSWEPGAFFIEYGGASATTGALTVLDVTVDHDGDGVTAPDGDCNDQDALVAPGATEVCGDSVDEDCDGLALACAPTGTFALSGRQVAVKTDYLAWAGDLNGDGLDDFFAVNEGTDDAFGLYAPFSPETLADDEAYDFTFTYGTSALAGALAAFGDVDGDGANDLAIGVVSAATVVVIPSTELDTASATSSRWWTITGATSATKLGASLASAGDLDGDGVGGLLVGATGTDSSRGAVYVFRSDLPRGSLTVADAELTFTGSSSRAYLGSKVTTLGDLDGDGLDDIAFTDTDTSTLNADTTYIWFGDGTTGTVAAEDVPLQIVRSGSAGALAAMPYPVGDLDGDGADDLLVANPDFNTFVTSPESAGRVYVWSGAPAPGSHTNTSADLVITGTMRLGGFGSDLATQLDLDGDGARDLAVLQPDSGVSSATKTWWGSVWLWYGPVTLSGTWLDTDGDAEITGTDLYDNVDDYVETAGDVDGDGFMDLWAGAYLVRGGPR